MPGHEPLGGPEALAGSLTLAPHGGDALARGDDLGVQARGLGDELTDLDADLLTALEKALQLALDLLHRLADVGEAMIARHQRLTLLPLARGHRGDPGVQLALAVPH